MFDPVEGGFGPAPKFPMPVYLEFLLDHYGRTKDESALQMVSFTMQKMSAGGLYDQLGGGFAEVHRRFRFSVKKISSFVLFT